MIHSKDVSVIITCYNYATYLKSAIDSVLSQTVPVGEIIVVNDGSTDHTDDIMKSFESNSLIKYVRQSNKGQAHAKNRGVKEARGSWVAFLDADDLWKPSKIEKQLPLFQDAQVGVVYTRQQFIDQNGDIMSPQPNRLPVVRGNVVSALLIDNFVPFSSAMIRKECGDAMGFFDESYEMSIDWDLWLRFATQYTFDYVNEDLLLYRQDHPGQMSRDMETRHACSDKIFSNFLKKYGDRLNPGDVREAMRYTYNTRGYSLRGVNPVQSYNYYVRSFMEDPFQLKALAGMFLAWMKYEK